MAWTTFDLLAAVRAKGMFPDASTGSYGPDNLLLFASDELLGKLVPMILGVREKYYETYVPYALTASQSAYAVPSRAIGGVLSGVQYAYNLAIWPLQPIDPTNVTTTNGGMSPRCFYFENDNVIIYPTPNVTQGTLYLRHFQRPSKLDQTINCAPISTIDTVHNTVVVSAVPSGWTTGTIVDFVTAAKGPPYGLDKTITNIDTNTNTISFTALPTTDVAGNTVSVAAGDYLALSGYTPIPEIPVEFQQLLVHMTLVRALQSVGDMANYQIAKAELAELKADAVKLITPRDQLGLKRVCSNWRNW